MKAIAIYVLFFVSKVYGLHLPKYIKACSPNSLDFEECAIRNGNEAISQLVKGDRQYGIPSFLPFKMAFVTISFNGLEMNLTDASFSGLENLKLQSYMFDPVKKISSVTLKGPLISFEFDYLTKGRIAAFPIEGKGHGFAKFFNASYAYTYNFDVKIKNKKHYMVIGKDNIKIEPENVECELGNLFNGNKQLGDNLNKFLNENWRELLTEFSPVVSEVNSLIAKEILRKIYERIPLEELFPGIVL